jgi:transaldolase
VADHGEVTGDTVSGTYDEANKLLDAVAAQGIAYTDVVEQLEEEGLDKFVASWNQLLGTVQAALDNAGKA